jgi:predicted nucleotidyltransferase
VEAQLEEIVRGLRGVLGDNLVGAYLHGSAVLGGLRPRSDIDVIAVVRRRATEGEKRRLAQLALGVSGRGGDAVGRRPLELDVVVQGEIHPWRYPPRFEFHYSELWRERFEHGELEPWSKRTNVDLASAITMALAGDTPLHGPPAADVFERVPRSDYVDAVLRDVDTVDDYIEWDARNVILTLPRIWTAVATEEIHSKDSAAEWALARLPEQHRPVLERARAVYRGEADEPAWDRMRPQVRAYLDHVLGEIALAR